MENYCLEVTWTVEFSISTLCMQGARDEWKLYNFNELLVPKCNRVHIVYFINEWGYSKYYCAFVSPKLCTYKQYKLNCSEKKFQKLEKCNFWLELTSHVLYFVN